MIEFRKPEEGTEEATAAAIGLLAGILLSEIHPRIAGKYVSSLEKVNPAAVQVVADVVQAWERTWNVVVEMYAEEAEK